MHKSRKRQLIPTWQIFREQILENSTRQPPWREWGLQDRKLTTFSELQDCAGVGGYVMI
jgi:hypothetical protein